MGRILIFIAIFGFIFIGVPLYVGWRVIRPIGLPGHWNLAAWIFLEGMVLSVPAMMSLGRSTETAFACVNS